MLLRTTSFVSPARVKSPARSAWVFQLDHDDDEVILPGSPPKPAEIVLEMGLVIAGALGLAVVVGLAL